MKRSSDSEPENPPKRVCKAPEANTIALSQATHELSEKLLNANKKIEELEDDQRLLKEKLNDSTNKLDTQSLTLEDLRGKIKTKNAEVEDLRGTINKKDEEIQKLKQELGVMQQSAEARSKQLIHFQALEGKNKELQQQLATEKQAGLNSTNMQTGLKMQLEQRDEAIKEWKEKVVQLQKELANWKKDMKTKEQLTEELNKTKEQAIVWLQRVIELEDHYKDCETLSEHTEKRAESWVKSIQRILKQYLDRIPEDSEIKNCLEDMEKEMLFQKIQYGKERPASWYDNEPDYTYTDESIPREIPIRIKGKITIPSFAEHLRSQCESASDKLTEIFGQKGGSVKWEAVHDPNMKWLSGWQITVAMPRPAPAKESTEEPKKPKQFCTYTYTTRQTDKVVSKWICLQVVLEALRQADWIDVHKDPDFQAIRVPSLTTLDAFWKSAQLEKDVMEIKDQMSRELEERNHLIRENLSERVKANKNLNALVSSFKDRNQRLLYSLSSSKGHHSGKSLVKPDSVILIDKIVQERPRTSGPSGGKEYLVKFHGDFGDLWISEGNLVLAEGQFFINHWRQQQVKVENSF